jgi:hypothetical protein
MELEKVIKQIWLKYVEYEYEYEYEYVDSYPQMSLFVRLK